ncbi:hypothetical protein QTO98_27425 [Klebsiella oxytoca]|nr:hypothetical protein [Klebsiella oxytoca]MDM4563968.1 hypothetical protein [Klebsiella oxytoca]
MIGIFKYAAKKDMVLGISDQQTGARAVILPMSSPLRKVRISGEILLG